MELQQKYLTESMKNLHLLTSLPPTFHHPKFNFAVETTPKSLWLNTRKVNCLLTEPAWICTDSAPHSHSGTLADSPVHLKTVPPNTLGLLHHCGWKRDSHGATYQLHYAWSWNWPPNFHSQPIVQSSHMVLGEQKEYQWCDHDHLCHILGHFTLPLPPPN